jgi:D-beta-D-heptose 7-phosphate kinase/D-beta-D-heptose 1-phosphate adenosyltransferase
MLIIMKKVFVNGTFDLLHVGHLELLNFAKSYGDYLIVAIDDDNRVKEKKGFDRPIHNQNERMFFLNMLKPVNQVEIFSSDKELEELIKGFNPDIMVVGSDWKNKLVIGSQFAKRLIFFDRINGYSTTKIIQSVIDRR